MGQTWIGCVPRNGSCVIFLPGSGKAVFNFLLYMITQRCQERTRCKAKSELSELQLSTVSGDEEVTSGCAVSSLGLGID